MASQLSGLSLILSPSCLRPSFSSPEALPRISSVRLPFGLPASAAVAIAGARVDWRRRVSSAGSAPGVHGARVSEVSEHNARPIVVIDNYDSFTYNLCQYVGELGEYFEVYRNDETTVDEIKLKNPKGILISPGPVQLVKPGGCQPGGRGFDPAGSSEIYDEGMPQESGISLQVVLEFGPYIPLFGVCMGLQCIGEAFGGKIVRSPSGVVHGKSSPVYYNEEKEDSLFYGLPNPFSAARYHSLVIEKDSFPNDALEITAWTEDFQIMAARHREYRHLQGVQFHPESIITTQGKTIVHNFLKQIQRLEASDCPA